ncbi:hypothetical protein [Fimbriiglobus ruber]|uniref:Cytoplasmic axial filament protein CafA and Ribonuclease G n=1 Tax=Fimbriiglobus ruber TaxID=1908690 RepID=A0A225D3J0_9BACT|nr:hypothetical protein [Fimbriiglobus ruber]OWK36161.1 Cytoplasmic axial filament protein CafA and Ribonuclease G [Fimbriiglobus ruber]
MIRFTCPVCGAAYSADDARAGKRGKCPKCQAEFLIPAPEPGTESAASLPPKPEAVADAAVEINPCPGCQVRLSVAPSDLGMNVECPYCKTAFLASRVGLPDSVPPADAGTTPRPPDEHDHDEDNERPRRRRSSRRADEDEDRDRYDRRRNRKPGAISAIGGMLLGGGIYALIHDVGVGAGTCCLWPGIYLSLVWAILAIVRGSAMLGQDDRGGPPKTLAILQIVLIINGDVVNMILGIIALTQLNTPEAQDYFERHGSYDN